MLCDSCRELLNYAYGRIDACPYKTTKSFCSNCKVHCYQPQKREKIRAVMRYAGPRMLYKHPVMAIKHMISTKLKNRK